MRMHRRPNHTNGVLLCKARDFTSNKIEVKMHGDPSPIGNFDIAYSTLIFFFFYLTPPLTPDFNQRQMERCKIKLG